MHIRLAVPEEIPAVAALLTRSGLPLAGVEDLWRTWVAVDDRDLDDGDLDDGDVGSGGLLGGRLLGCAGLEPRGEAYLFRFVAVHPDARGTGVGGAVVAAALAAVPAGRPVALLTKTADQFPRFAFRPVSRAARPGAGRLRRADYRLPPDRPGPPASLGAGSERKLTVAMAERTTLRALLRRPPYRRLWIARTVSQWGDAFNTVALALLVYGLTGSGLGVSAVVVAEILPGLLLAPLAGALVDRLPRVRVMIGADLARAGLAFALPFLDGSVAAVYAIAVGLSAGAVFFNPAAQSVVPAMVRELDLVAANSGLWTAAVVSQVVLAPLAGVVVAAFGYTTAFWINAASYLLSAAVLRRLTLPAAPASTARAPWYTQAREGISAVTNHRLLRALAAAQFLAALSAGATGALLVVLAREHLGLDARDYGLLLGAIGVGAATGPLILSRLTSDPRRPGYVLGPFVLRAVVDAGLATLTGLVSAMAALVAYGIGTSTGAVTFNSLLQAETPERLRGRVFASFDMLWQTGRLLSLLAGGLLADTLGIRAVYYLGAALLLAAAAAGWAGLRSNWSPAATSAGL